MYPSTISWTRGKVLLSIAMYLWLEWKFISNNYWSCSVDRAPSDEGLYKVLQEHPNWETYAIPLGLKAGQVNYFYHMKRGDNGILALRTLEGRSLRRGLPWYMGVPSEGHWKYQRS